MDQESGKEIFDETASREGLIENKAFKELKVFTYKVLYKAMFQLASAEAFMEAKRRRDEKLAREKSIIERYYNLQEEIRRVQEKNQSNDPDKDKTNDLFLKSLPQKLDQVKKEIEENQKEELKEKIKEVAMLQVLAGTGLVIGEFVHEIEQFDTDFELDVNNIEGIVQKSQCPHKSQLLADISSLRTAFKNYKFYSAYFRASISANTKRELEPINVKQVINEFVKRIKPSSIKSGIYLEKKYDVMITKTCPMHPSEWLSILFNLYTNSKKAIIRAAPKDKCIGISAYSDEKNVFIKFQDNGDGIAPENENKIFRSFFTTANPIGTTKKDLEENTGTGLGLYIIKNIIVGYNGTIKLVDPTPPYTTCFMITLPNEKYGK